MNKLLTAATLTAIALCSAPLVAQPRDKTVDIVVSQPEADPWTEHVSGRLERELGRAFNERDFSGSGIVRVVFQLSGAGEATNVEVYDYQGVKPIVREATSAVRRLRIDMPTPTHHAVGQKYIASLVFASSSIEARKLAVELGKLERERLASAGEARTYLAIR